MDDIIQRLSQLPSSAVNRTLVFPIYLTACMTDDSAQRAFLKGRLQDESVGYLMQTRAQLEAVWRGRDGNHTLVDWRESIREGKPNLLLV